MRVRTSEVPAQSGHDAGAAGTAPDSPALLLHPLIRMITGRVQKTFIDPQLATHIR
ncbi:MAG: hypothetical protein JWM63_2956 [Gammaproteobacteria bacterium]|nr:hypothetical protein [Gammaproteobacteria bacterium]